MNIALQWVLFLGGVFLLATVGGFNFTTVFGV